MFLLKLVFVYNFLCVISQTNSTAPRNVMVSQDRTKVERTNIFLSRKKRYLAFPKGSNFVMTLSMVKPLLSKNPRGHNVLAECDVPFALPSDTGFFNKNEKTHRIQKRDIYKQLELALTENGFNGSACLKRILCEARRLNASPGESLICDILSVVFRTREDELDNEYKNACTLSNFRECDIPLFNIILGSFLHRQY